MGLRKISPISNISAHFIDNRRRIVLLLFSRKTSPLIEDDFLLRCRILMLLGLGDRRKEVRASALFEDALGWLPLAVQFPMLQEQA